MKLSDRAFLCALAFGLAAGLLVGLAVVGDGDPGPVVVLVVECPCEVDGGR